MPQTRRGSSRSRRGFNLLELFLAMALFGLLAAFGAPRLAAAREHAAVRSARQQVHGYLLTARSTAMQRGRPATFHASTATDAIWVAGSLATDTVAPRRQLATEFGVALSGSIDEVRFNSRGFATNLAGNGVIRVSRSGYSDSLCVSRLGAITTRCGF